MLLATASPASRGLFHGAISLSGSPNISMALAQALPLHYTFVQQANCTRDTPAEELDCVYNLSARQV